VQQPGREVSVAQREGGPAERGREQYPLAAAVEGVAEVAVHSAAWHVELVLDPRNGRPVEVTAGFNDAEGHAEPQQRPVDTRVARAADETNGERELAAEQPTHEETSFVLYGAVSE
jgi:hypothetical protein